MRVEEDGAAEPVTTGVVLGVTLRAEVSDGILRSCGGLLDLLFDTGLSVELELWLRVTI